MSLRSSLLCGSSHIALGRAIDYPRQVEADEPLVVVAKRGNRAKSKAA